MKISESTKKVARDVGVSAAGTAGGIVGTYVLYKGGSIAYEKALAPAGRWIKGLFSKKENKEDDKKLANAS